MFSIVYLSLQEQYRKENMKKHSSQFGFHESYDFSKELNLN